VKPTAPKLQLIVAVISIALVAALAIASIFYGGDAFTKSSTKAQVTTLINQGQQIAGAAALFKTDNGYAPTDIEADLVNGDIQYLANLPTGTKSTSGNWEISGDATRIAVVPTAAADLCGADSGGDEYCTDGNGGAGQAYFEFAL